MPNHCSMDIKSEIKVVLLAIKGGIMVSAPMPVNAILTVVPMRTALTILISSPSWHDLTPRTNM